MFQMELTQKIVTGCIAGTDSGEQNAKISLILAIFMFATVLLAPLGVLCLVLRNKNRKMIQCVLDKKYTLQEDIVLNKYISSSTDGPDSYFMVFMKAGRKELHFPYAVINSVAVTAVPNLYESTEIGDTVYLLCAEKGKVMYMFNRRFWQLNENEFSKVGEQFVPRDNTAT